MLNLSYPESASVLLHNAAKYGNESSIKASLLAGAKVNATNEDGRTALLEAVINGHGGVVAELLDAGANANAIDKNGRTALLEAARKRFEAIVEMLLGAGADANATANNGDTALLEATRNKDEVIVKMLLDAGADANASAKHGSTALMEAGYDGCDKIVEMLLDADAFDDDGYRVLSLAARQGHEGVVKMLAININADTNAALTDAVVFGCKGSILKILLDAGADANIIGSWGCSALYLATINGHEEMAKVLLDAGADVNVTTSYEDLILLPAAKQGYEGIVKMLLDAGVDVNTTDRTGNPALLEASKNGHEGIVKMLLDAGADANATDRTGNPALPEAARNGHEGIVKMLLHAGSDASIVDGIEDLALPTAARNGHEVIMKMLLDSGVDSNKFDKDGYTPLQLAAQAGHENIVKLLLAANVNIDQRPKDRNGISLHQAIANGHLSIVKLLGESDMSARDSDGRTPLHIASSQGRLDILDYLLELKTSDINALDKDALTPSKLAQKRGRRDACIRIAIAKADQENEDHKNRMSLQDALATHDIVTVEQQLKTGADMRGFKPETWRATLSATDKQVIVIVEDGMSQSIVKIFTPDVCFPLNNSTRHLCCASGLNMASYVNLMPFLNPWQDLPSLTQERVKLRFMKNAAAVEWIWSPTEPGASSPGIPKPDQIGTKSLIGASLKCYARFTYFQKDMESQEDFRVAEQQSRIFWIMIPKPHINSHGLGLSNLGSGDDTVILWSRYFMSSLGCGWIPGHGVEFFHLCLIDLIQNWSELLDAAESHLVTTHGRVLEKRGRSHSVIETLLTNSRMWATLQNQLADHIDVANKFLGEYAKNDFLYHEVIYLEEKNKSTFPPIDDPKIKNDLTEDIKTLEEFSRKIQKLNDDTRDMIQLEFKLVSIYEAQRSTSMAASMQRLSWVTFIFLPLMFASSLLGMNINLLKNNPAWWWYVLVVGVVLFLALLGWIIFKYIKIEEYLENTIGRHLERKVEHLSAKLRNIRQGKGNTDEDVERGKEKEKTV